MIKFILQEAHIFWPTFLSLSLSLFLSFFLSFFHHLWDQISEKFVRLALFFKPAQGINILLLNAIQDDCTVFGWGKKKITLRLNATEINSFHGDNVQIKCFEIKVLISNGLAH